MASLTKFIFGLILSTFIAPLGILFLFSCIGVVIGLYKWYLNSWEQGQDIFSLVLTTTFSWGAIKFYLLAWGVGIVMVCSMTYQNFKTGFHAWFRKSK